MKFSLHTLWLLIRYGDKEIGWIRPGMQRWGWTYVWHDGHHAGISLGLFYVAASY